MDTHVRLQYLDDPTSAFLKGQTLEHDIIRGGLLNVDKRVLSAIGLEDVRVNLVADLAPESPPVYGLAHTCLALALLRFQPVLEADVMDKPDTSTAFAN